jgi:hypothetical protein
MNSGLAGSPRRWGAPFPSTHTTIFACAVREPWRTRGSPLSLTRICFEPPIDFGRRAIGVRCRREQNGCAVRERRAGRPRILTALMIVAVMRAWTADRLRSGSFSDTDLRSLTTNALSARSCTRRRKLPIEGKKFRRSQAVANRPIHITYRFFGGLGEYPPILTRQNRGRRPAPNPT